MPDNQQQQQQQLLQPIMAAAQPLPLDITEYPGPGTKGKQWLRIIKMYADEFGWTPAKFLQVTQLRASGDLYHKLEGFAVTGEVTSVEQVFTDILKLIQPQVNLYDDLWACQRDGRRPTESMEALASRVKIKLSNYEKATGSKFTEQYYVDVFINMIRDEDLGMVLRDKEPDTLDKAIRIGARWLNNKSNTKRVCTKAQQQPQSTTYREPQQFQDEPMEVDQLRFQGRRNSVRRPFQTSRGRPESQNRGRRRTSHIICHICEKEGHTGHNCLELKRCKEMVTKYEEYCQKFPSKFDPARNRARVQSQERRETKLRQMQKMIQELEINEGAPEPEDHEEFTDAEDEPRHPNDDLYLDNDTALPSEVKDFQ